jgi:hypothetical protein
MEEYGLETDCYKEDQEVQILHLGSIYFLLPQLMEYIRLSIRQSK